MESYLDVIPFSKECKGTAQIPGSKSISNRALLLACFLKGKTELSGVLKSQDVEVMVSSLKKAGVRIIEDWNNSRIEITGCRGIAPIKNQHFMVQNAGTVARFLPAWLAIQKNAVYFMDGSEEMRKRPVGELLECFQAKGVQVLYENKEGFFPFSIKTTEYKHTDWCVDASKSSQMLSALMMIAPLISKSEKITFPSGTVSKPFLSITGNMIKEFSGDDNFKLDILEDEIRLEGQYLRSEKFLYSIEPDATAASYFLTLPLVVGGSCEVLGVWNEMLQGDANYCQVLRKLGAGIKDGTSGLISNRNGSLIGGEFNFNDISDTFLTLAAISPLLSDAITIKGIAHTRMQETDRILAMTNELRKLGQQVNETTDSIHIIPDFIKLKKAAQGIVEIDTYQDHRVAMSFAILGSFDLFNNGKPWMRIKNPNCCSKTFPNFFETLSSIRTQSIGI